MIDTCCLRIYPCSESCSSAGAHPGYRSKALDVYHVTCCDRLNGVWVGRLLLAPQRLSSFPLACSLFSYEAKGALSGYQALGRILGELDVLLRDVGIDRTTLSKPPHSLCPTKTIKSSSQFPEQPSSFLLSSDTVTFSQAIGVDRPYQMSTCKS